MSLQLSRYLKDFSAPRLDIMPMTPRYFPDMDDMSERSAAARPAPVPAIDLEAERRDAFEEGHAEATADLHLRHAADLAERDARYAAELEALQSRFEDEISTVIASRFAEMATDLGVLIGDQVARVLAPLMDEVLVEKSVRDMAALIAGGLRDGEACTITVKGPAALFEKLKFHLGEGDVAFRHSETGDTDLSVEYADRILVTRMAVWSDAVRKVLT